MKGAAVLPCTTVNYSLLPEKEGDGGWGEATSALQLWLNSCDTSFYASLWKPGQNRPHTHIDSFLHLAARIKRLLWSVGGLGGVCVCRWGGGCFREALPDQRVSLIRNDGRCVDFLSNRTWNWQLNFPKLPCVCVCVSAGPWWRRGLQAESTHTTPAKRRQEI